MNTQEQLNKAMAYVELHLFDEINIATVAQFSGCSVYHFKRVFSFLAGMPFSEYVRLRKLSVAAERLQTEDVKIIDLALWLGYESSDAFSSAFKQFHGATPSLIKKRQATCKTFSPLTFHLTVKGGTQMDYKIVEKPVFHIVGFKKRITLVFYGINPQINSLYEQLTPETIAVLKGLSNTAPQGMLSVSANFSDRTVEGSELDQYIGVATTNGIGNLPVSFDVLAIPAYTWAVFTSVGAFPAALQNTWANIFSEWLPTSGYELCDGPELLWHEHPDTTAPNYKSEIWIPVIKAT